MNNVKLFQYLIYVAEFGFQICFALFGIHDALAINNVQLFQYLVYVAKFEF